MAAVTGSSPCWQGPAPRAWQVAPASCFTTAVGARFRRYERWRGYGGSYQPERDMVHKHLQRHPHIEQPPPSVQSWHSRRERSRQSSRGASHWSAALSRAS